MKGPVCACRVASELNDVVTVYRLNEPICLHRRVSIQCDCRQFEDRHRRLMAVIFLADKNGVERVGRFEVDDTRGLVARIGKPASNPPIRYGIAEDPYHRGDEPCRSLVDTNGLLARFAIWLTSRRADSNSQGLRNSQQCMPTPS